MGLVQKYLAVALIGAALVLVGGRVQRAARC